MTTSETHHEPSPDELEHGTGRPALHHPGDIADEAHGPDDHGETDGHDDHAHASETLGPVDVRAWGALVIGILAGLLVVACIVISTTLLAPATTL